MHGCTALTQAAAKESIRRDVEASTTKEKYKHADEVMASKIDRLERKIRDLTKRGEELHDHQSGTEGTEMRQKAGWKRR